MAQNLKMRSIETENWTTIIKPRTGWFTLNISELWRYKDLILLFVRRDFVAIYKQTILGPLWFFLQPIFSTFIFTIVFSQIAQIPTDGIPPTLFYLSGIIMWNYFSTCLTKTSDTFVSNSGIFGKVYFPRLTVPISIIITNYITFFIQFTLFIILLLYFWLRGSSIQSNEYLLLLPLLLFQVALLALGCGIIISSLTTKYRDLTQLIGFGVQLWMYATPVVYPLSQIPDKWQWLYMFNPMSSIVETFRYAFLGTGIVHPIQIVLSAGMTIIILMIGIVLFTHVEKTFMDTV